jgi:hypothetical protein
MSFDAMSRSAPTLTTTPEALPPAVRELVRVIGEADAMRLIGLHGGARMSVPKQPKADHALRMALSPAGFDQLVAGYGGESLDVPKGDAYLRRLRHDHVRQCRAQGLTIDDTAEATGYTRRHVINIMGGEADGGDTRTLDLFADPVVFATSSAGKANDPFGIGASHAG